MKRKWSKAIIVLLGYSLMLSGCGNLSQTLAEKAENYARGREEAPYYLQSSGYRMKDLLAAYTSEYRQLVWEYGELKEGTEPQGWGNQTADSDSCVSSSREMHLVLEEALKKVALGVSLHFDRSNFLPDEEEIKEWLSVYVRNHPLETLGLEKVTVYQQENVSDCIYYLVFSYSTGLEMVKELREQTKDAVTEVNDAVNEEILSDREKAEVVWSWVTEYVCYPEEDDSQDAYWHADGALLEQKAVNQGYAEAACLLLSALGLENEIVFKTQDTYVRLLNRVRVDGEWYQMDCCFGAQTKNTDFFLMKEEEE